MVKVIGVDDVWLCVIVYVESNFDLLVVLIKGV